MLACWGLAALPPCPRSHSCPMWGSACSSGEQPVASGTQGGTLGPGTSEKSIDFGFGWAWLLATASLIRPCIGHGAAYWQGGHSRWMDALTHTC